MKRTLTLIVAVCLLTLTLTACGGETCRVCGEKATAEYRYSGVGSANVTIGDRVHIFYATGETDHLCDDCLKIVEAALGPSK